MSRIIVIVFAISRHDQLLEDHYKQLREEEGIESGDEEEDDEAAWDNWEVESDSSDSTEGWVDVSSDSEDDIEISDSEDEGEQTKGKKKGKQADIAEPPEEAFAQNAKTKNSTGREENAPRPKRARK